MSDVSPSCIIYLTKFKQVINGHKDNCFDKTDIDLAIDQLQTFVKSMKFEEQHMKELEELINGVKILVYKLLHDLADIQSDIKTIKKDKQELQKTVDDLIADKNGLQNAFYDLKSEFTKLKENTSEKVLTETYAHLLKPLIKQIDEKFQKRNEQTKNMSSPTSYNMINHYNKNILKKIMSGAEINDEAMQLVSDVIDEFSKAAELTENQVIELLLKKTKRNYMAHSYIDIFINDLIADEYAPDDFIKYIEDENFVNLSIGKKEKDLLMKLLQYNVCHRRKSNDKKLH